MYQSMSEIKKQQRIINRKIQKLMELHEEQCQQCAGGDSELMGDLKSQIYYLNRKLKKLLEIQERHNHYWPDDHNQKQSDYSKSDEQKDDKDKKEHKEEPKLEFESSSKVESSSKSESCLKVESSSKFESSSKVESSSKSESCLKVESSSKSESSSKVESSSKPKPVPEIALKPAIELKDEPDKEDEDAHDHEHEHNHDHDHPKPEPPPQHNNLFGFAYTLKGSDKSGVVKFQIAGPLHEGVSLTSRGLKLNKSGVYQINYSVSLNAMVQTTIPASFELKVNDSIVIEASLTQLTTTGHLSTSVLFSLLSGDVVMLVAQLPAGVVYTSANLQIVQVG